MIWSRNNSEDWEMETNVCLFQLCFGWKVDYPNYVPLWNALHSQAMQEKVLKKTTTPMFLFLLTLDCCLCPAITFCCSTRTGIHFQPRAGDRNIICFEERRTTSFNCLLASDCCFDVQEFERIMYSKAVKKKCESEKNASVCDPTKDAAVGMS
jgi:hypothetical protein